MKNYLVIVALLISATALAGETVRKPASAGSYFCTDQDRGGVEPALEMYCDKTMPFSLAALPYDHFLICCIKKK
jgi:hypothetical protein